MFNFPLSKTILSCLKSILTKNDNLFAAVKFGRMSKKQREKVEDDEPAPRKQKAERLGYADL